MSTEWRRIGLFVSNTFEDMHAERDYLVKRVLPQLQEWCEARRLHLADIDLRWGITEAAATRERSVVLKCLQAIDGSQPLFLCLVGQRRGRVTAPEGVAEATFEAYPETRAQIGTATVTEIEIAHAMGDGDGRRPGALFYLRDPEALTGLPAILRAIYTNDWLDDPDERGRHAEAQEATKELARRRAVVTREYAARWDTGATTPELALPVECPFSDPDRVRAWQQRWAAVGVTVTGTAVPPQLVEHAEATTPS